VRIISEWRQLAIREKHVFYLFLAPTIVVLLTVTIYPLIYSLALCFHRYYLNKPQLGWQLAGLDNFRWVVSDSIVRTIIWNTFYITALAVSIEFVLGFSLALILNREFRGKDVFRTLLLIPMVLPPIVVALNWKHMYLTQWGVINWFLSTIGLVGTTSESWIDWMGNAGIVKFSIAIVDVWQWTPFMILILLAGLQAIPQEPYEAALVDGASRVQIFRNLTLPLMKPMILIALLLRTMDLIRMFDIPYILTYGGPGYSSETVSLFTFKLAWTHANMGHAATLSWVLLIIIEIVCIGFIRIFRDVAK